MCWKISQWENQLSVHNVMINQLIHLLKNEYNVIIAEYKTLQICFHNKWSNHSNKLMAKCKSALSPVHQHCRCSSFALILVIICGLIPLPHSYHLQLLLCSVPPRALPSLRRLISPSSRTISASVYHLHATLAHSILSTWIWFSLPRWSVSALQLFLSIATMISIWFHLYSCCWSLMLGVVYEIIWMFTHDV